MEALSSPRRVLRLTLSALRQNRGWSRRRLAESSGVSLRAVESWEEGTRGITARTFHLLANRMGYQPVQVEALLLALNGLGEPGAGSQVGSPLERAADERREVQLRALREGLAHARVREAGLLARLQAQQIGRDREEAEALLAELLPLGAEERVASTAARLDGTSLRWAFVERASAHALRELARDVQRGKEWAYFALECAIDPNPAVEARLCGYAWAFAGHAHRLGGDLYRSESAFGWSRLFWEEGEAADALPLEVWRILELEAGLYRDLEQPEIALELHDLALAADAGSSTPLLLLSKAETLEGLGEPKPALACLEVAYGQADPSQTPKLHALLGWKRADLLSRLGRWRETLAFLDQVRDSALDLGRPEDLARCLWLQGRCEAAQGRDDRAIACLRQARAQLQDLKKSHEPVEVALELVALHLLRGETLPARKVVEEVGRGSRNGRLSEGARYALQGWQEVAGRGGELLPWAQRALAELRRCRPRTRP